MPSLDDRIHFGVITFVHETLYGLFKDPYTALAAAGLQPGQTVLEVGCGPGFFTVPAARVVGPTGKLVALDIEPLAVDRTRRKVQGSGLSNVTVMLADASSTGLPESSFDLIFVFGFRHGRGPSQAIQAELWRLLKAGGILATEGQLWPESDLFASPRRAGRFHQFTKRPSVQRPKAAVAHASGD